MPTFVDNNALHAWYCWKQCRVPLTTMQNESVQLYVLWQLPILTNFLGLMYIPLISDNHRTNNPLKWGLGIGGNCKVMSNDSIIKVHHLLSSCGDVWWRSSCIGYVVRNIYIGEVSFWSSGIKKKIAQDMWNSFTYFFKSLILIK